MIVKDFVMAHWLDILLVLGGIGAIFYLYFTGQKQVIRNTVLDLVRRAEQKLGGKTGELKYAYVVNEVYTRLPKHLTIFLTRKFLDKLIEDGVKILKDYLDDGLLNNSYLEISEIVEEIE